MRLVGLSVARNESGNGGTEDSYGIRRNVVLAIPVSLTMKRKAREARLGGGRLCTGATKDLRVLR